MNLTGKPHKGSWGDRYIIEPRPNKSRITCNFCMNYCSDGSCIAKPIVVADVGYDYWKQCSEFSLSEEYNDDVNRMKVNNIKRFQSPYYSGTITPKVKRRKKSIESELPGARIHRITIGTKVGLYDYTCKRKVIYTLVQPQNADILHARLSIDTPLGKALLNKRTNDIIEVNTLDGKEKYRIIWYK